MVERSFYLKQLIKTMGNGKIKVLSGVTGSGKSYLLNKIYSNYLMEHGVDKSHIIYVDLENFRFNNANEVDEFISRKMVKGKHYYIFIDELFYIPDYLMLLLEYANNKIYDVYVTVSDLDCSVLSSKSLFQMIHIYPLSFSEYVSYKKDVNRSQILEEYLSYGGLAGLLCCKNDNEKRIYLKNFCDNKILMHIIKAHNIYNENAFLSLTKTFAYDFGCITTPYRCVDIMKNGKEKNVSDKTIKTYTEYLISSSLLHQSKRYLIKEEKYSKTAARYYFEDVGLLNYNADFKLKNRFLKLQNVIFIELKRRGYDVCCGFHSYLKKINKKPVRLIDNIPFVAITQTTKYFIDFAETTEQIAARSETLVNIKNTFKKIVLVDDNIKTYTTEKGVVVMSVTDFLLNKDSLDI